MQTAIQKIQPADAEILSALAKQTFYDTFVGTCTDEDMNIFLEKYFNVPQLKTELEDTNSCNFFAIADNKPVGYIRFKEDYEGLDAVKKWKAIELKRLYIVKEFQGKGIAQLLMDTYLNYAIENKFELAWLGVWEYNFKAQKFYSKYGLKYSGFEHPFPIGNTPQTDHWYWKFLT